MQSTTSEAPSPTPALTREQLYERTRAVLRPEATERQTCLVVGVGSGGARVAEELARFGVGRVILLDRPGEMIEPHNVIRHPLGVSSIGQLKVEAMAARLRDINPLCTVETVEMDVRCDPRGIETLTARCTLVLLCTDNEPSRHAVNRAAVRAGVPLVFASVFDGGCGGEVGRFLPGAACYACIAAALGRTRKPETTVEPESFDYSRPDGPQRSTAALNIDIAQIALLQARVALLTMLRTAGPPEENATDPLGCNYLVFANRAVSGVFDRMLQTERYEVDPLPDCLVCSRIDPDGANDKDLADRIIASARPTSRDADLGGECP